MSCFQITQQSNHVLPRCFRIHFVLRRDQSDYITYCLRLLQTAPYLCANGVEAVVISVLKIEDNRLAVNHACGHVGLRDVFEFAIHYLTLHCSPHGPQYAQRSCLTHSNYEEVGADNKVRSEPAPARS